MPRRATVVVAACVLLAACGAPHGTQTLDHEPDLADITSGSVPAGLRDEIANDVARLRRACAAIDTAVESVAPGTTLAVNDAQCQWLAPPEPSGVPRVVVGIVDGGLYRFHETARLLKDERTIPHIGDDALYDPQARVLFTVRANRLWYVQRVGGTEGQLESARDVITIAIALMRNAATS